MDSRNMPIYAVYFNDHGKLFPPSDCAIFQCQNSMSARQQAMLYKKQWKVKSAIICVCEIPPHIYSQGKEIINRFTKNKVFEAWCKYTHQSSDMFAA
jgi:hypothetical protein